MPSRSLSTVIRAVEESVRTRGLFTGDALERAKQRLVALMDAKVIVRGAQRDGNGRCIYVEVDDTAIQLAAAIKLIEFETGKAPQSVDITTQGPGEGHRQADDPVKLLQQNPELMREMLTSYLAAMKKAQKADSHEVTAVRADLPTESQSGGPPREAPPS